MVAPGRGVVPNITARTSIDNCFSDSASVLDGRLRYSSSSEKYSVLRYFRTVVVNSSSDGEVGSVFAVGSRTCGGFSLDTFFFVVDLVEVEDNAVLGRVWDEEGRVEEEGRGASILGVEGRADTRLRRVLGVAGRERASAREGGHESVLGVLEDVGVLDVGSLAWLKVVEMERRAVGGLARVEEVSLAELARFVCVMAGGIFFV